MKMGGGVSRIIYNLSKGAKYCKLSVKRDIHAVIGQSIRIFSFIYNAHNMHIAYFYNNICT